jgi:hypothetical protein
MERELGISYPTVRSRVEALVRALGFGPRDGDEASGDEASGTAAAGEATTAAASRQEILERLARHEIGAEDAAKAIRALGRTER